MSNLIYSLLFFAGMTALSLADDHRSRRRLRRLGARLRRP